MEIVALTDELRERTKILFRQVFSEDTRWEFSEDDLAVFDNPRLQWWVAVEDGAVAGFIAGCVGSPDDLVREFGIPHHIMTSSRIGYKAEFGVSPAFRGNGVGRLLTRVLLKYLLEEEVDQFLVYTLPGTNNYDRYSNKLNGMFECDDGRVFFYCNGIPTSL